MRSNSVCPSWIGIIILAGLLVLAPLARGAPRLALLAEDAAQETATCADLLTAALAQGGQVELVERTEIRRVLEEQKLSAAGLVSPEQTLALGKLLRAEGILFLSREAAGKTLTARLVDTRQGFIAGYWRYRLGTDPIEKTVGLLAADVRVGVGKLGATAEKPLLVSILRVGNATLDADFLWIEDELPLLLASLLTRDPRVLLLERRQLGQLLDETQTSVGGAAAFRTGGILLDADVALKPGVTVDPDRLKRTVIMTVRLRTPQLLELASVSVEGTTGQIDQLTAQAATQLLSRLHELKSIPATGDAAAEAKLFLEIARQQGTTTAADAAHALVPGDQTALENLVKSLMRPVPPKSSGDTGVHDAAVEWARNLARAADLIRSRVGTPLGDTFAFEVLNDCRLMKDQWSANSELSVKGKTPFQDPEIRTFLRPVGQVARLILESRRARWPDRIDSVETLLARRSFVDSDLEAVAYLEPILLARLDAKGDRSSRWREQVYTLFMALMDFQWKKAPQWRGFLDKAAHRPEPEVRYYAHACLALIDNDPDHVREMARLLPAFFEGSDEWLTSGQAGSVTFMSLDAVARLWQTESVECLGPVIQRILDKELVAGRLGALNACLDLLETHPWRPALVPPPAAAALVEKGLALAQELQAKAPTVPPPQHIKPKADANGAFVSSATKLLAQLRAQMGKAPVAVGSAKTGVEVLWRSGTPEWVAAFRNVGIDAVQTGERPPFCLVDGGSIWGFHLTRWTSAPVLLQADAATGRQLAMRLWQITPEQYAAMEETTRKSILSMDRGHAGVDDDALGGPWIMCRWRNDVCLTMWGLGVCLVPADAASKGEVRAIGRRQGLPALDLIGVAPAGDTLYIASRQALVAATAGQDRVKLIANLAGDTTASSLPRGWAIRALVADQAGKNLYLLLREPWKTPPAGYEGPLWRKDNRRCSVWALGVGTGQWRLVRDGLILDLHNRYESNPLLTPGKTGPVPRLPVAPGTAEDAVDYLARWASELLGMRMATLADGSVIATDHNNDDGEFYIYRAPPPAPVK